VDNFFTSLVLYVCVVNIPLARYGPIEYRSASRNLVYLEVYMRSDFPQGLTHTISGDTTANRKKSGRKSKYLFASSLRCDLFDKTFLKLRHLATNPDALILG